MIIGDKQNTPSVLNINEKNINNSREIEFLGIVIDNQLKFNKHIDSQFNYAPLIWMFASKTATNKILKIHYKTL